jgi:hypothetical protein
MPIVNTTTFGETTRIRTEYTISNVIKNPDFTQTVERYCRKLCEAKGENPESLIILNASLEMRIGNSMAVKHPRWMMYQEIATNHLLLKMIDVLEKHSTVEIGNV